MTASAALVCHPQRGGVTPPRPVQDAAAIAALDAARRAMPMQRLVGNGMDYADAVALHALAEQRVPWTDAACWLAEANLRRAEAACQAGHLHTARAAFFLAAACFRFGQSPLIHDTPDKIAVYRRAADAFARGAALAVPAPAPTYEKLAVPHADAVLHGWLVRPAGAVRPPCVIIFGGADGWREEYHNGALALIERGIAALLLDGPGQGETRILGGAHLVLPIEAAFSAAVGCLLDHPGVGDQVGIWGNSLGGTFAARTAATDPRLAACCVNGGSATPVEVLDAFPRFIERIRAMLGGADATAARAALDALALDALPAPARIACPLLVLHGAPDPIFTLASAERILDYTGPGAGPDARMLVWDDGDHCLYNHTHEKHAVVADWFADRLLPAR